MPGASLRLERGATLVLATHNAGKLAELAALCAPAGIRVRSAAEWGLAPPEEDGADYHANARIKARHVAAATGLASLADDSGLRVAALGGAPGLRSARWLEEFGRDGAFARIAEAVAQSGEDRAAFVCVVCLCLPDGATSSFCARAEGRIVPPRSTGQGFGYDPIFQPLGATRTYAETKPADTHRGRAFAQFALRWLR